MCLSTVAFGMKCRPTSRWLPRHEKRGASSISTPATVHATSGTDRAAEDRRRQQLAQRLRAVRDPGGARGRDHDGVAGHAQPVRLVTASRESLVERERDA